MFGGLGMQFQPDGYSVRNVFEDSLTEEGTGSGKAVFEGGFTFSASESRKKFDSIASEVQREEYWSASPSTQEHQQLEGQLNHTVK